MNYDGDYEGDRAWADKFLPHQLEIAHEAMRVEIAPIEEDLRRNTDLILRSVVPFGPEGFLRISARVRRVEYLSKRATFPGLTYRNQITMRDRRISGESERGKFQLGFGGVFVYGFESSPDSDRLYPWVLVNLDVLRDYFRLDGYSVVERNKGAGGSWLRVFCLDDLPPRAVIASDGITLEDQARREADSPWMTCRNPNWQDKDKPVRSGWCSGAYAVWVDQDTRHCLSCGFTWRTPRCVKEGN